MLQIIDLENHEQFQEISNEESLSVTGGNISSASDYATVATTLGINKDELANTTLLFAFDALNSGTTPPRPNGPNGPNGQNRQNGRP